MAQTTGQHVFISYSRKDDAVMRRIVAFLRARQTDVWIDNEKLVPGTPIWEEEIERAIRDSSAVIVILSPDARNSVWVRRELSFAEQYHKRIFPIMVAGNEDLSIPLRLITNQYVDARKNETIAIQSLHAAVLLYMEELVRAESNVPSTGSVSKPNIGQSKSAGFPIPQTIATFFETIGRLNLKTHFEAFFQTESQSKIEQSRLKRFLLFMFWFLLFLVGPPFFLEFVDFYFQNVVLLFWIAIVGFGFIGMNRAWRRESLVASSAVLGLAINFLYRKYSPMVRDFPDTDVSLFWIRVITLEIFIYFGYKISNWAFDKRPRISAQNLQDRGLGWIAGALNGYLIAGSILFYNHLADYPFQNVIRKASDPSLLYSINSMMIYMPPQLLGEPAIYFAVILAIMVIWIVLI